MLDNKEEKIQFGALRAVGNIAFKNDEVTQVILDYEVLSHVRFFLDHRNEQTVKVIIRESQHNSMSLGSSLAYLEHYSRNEQSNSSSHQCWNDSEVGQVAKSRKFRDSTRSCVGSFEHCVFWHAKSSFASSRM
jgi:hypothetical protein